MDSEDIEFRRRYVGGEMNSVIHYDLLRVAYVLLQTTQSITTTSVFEKVRETRQRKMSFGVGELQFNR